MLFVHFIIRICFCYDLLLDFRLSQGYFGCFPLLITCVYVWGLNNNGEAITGFKQSTFNPPEETSFTHLSSLYQLIHFVAILNPCHLWNPSSSAFQVWLLQVSPELIPFAFQFPQTSEIFWFVSIRLILDLFIYFRIFSWSCNGSLKWERGNHCAQSTNLIEHTEFS